MRLQLLGTGGYHPNERRHTACLLVPELPRNAMGKVQKNLLRQRYGTPG